MPVHIFDETDPLEEVLVWGEPGIEALLGQLLPKSRSLFFSYYEVLEARNEFWNMQKLIVNEEIIFTRAKDAFAKSLEKNESKSIKELENALLQRAAKYYEEFRENKVREFSHERIHGDIDQLFLRTRKDISQVLDEDIVRYGEIPAIRLNYLLSLSYDLPLANIFYGRDQSQTLTGKIILSTLKWGIRKPEVGIFKVALTELGYGSDFIEIDHGTIEGGDIAILGDTCYIGVGARTTTSAVKNLCRKVGPLLESQGIQIVMVINKRHAEEASTFGAPTEEHMRIMHLDMFWIPLKPQLVMAYGNEIDQREVIRVSRNMDILVVEELGGFREFLSEKGIEILEVSEQEQKNFATNLLNLGNNTLVAALSTNTRVITELEKRGFRVLSAELNKLVNGYGAIHCLTAPIKRALKIRK